MKVSSRSTTRIAACFCLVSFLTLLPSGLSAREHRRSGARDSIAASTRFAFRLPTEPVAVFKSVTLEHGLRINGHNGFRIHSHLIVTGRLNIACLVEAYFFDSEGKEIPGAPNSDNVSSANKAVVYKRILPNYPSTEYQDLQIFVPTTTFHALSKGSHDITVRVYVVSDNKVIGISGNTDFVLTL